MQHPHQTRPSSTSRTRCHPQSASCTWCGRRLSLPPPTDTPRLSRMSTCLICTTQHSNIPSKTRTKNFSFELRYVPFDSIIIKLKKSVTLLIGLKEKLNSESTSKQGRGRRPKHGRRRAWDHCRNKSTC